MKASPHSSAGSAQALTVQLRALMNSPTGRWSVTIPTFGLVIAVLIAWLSHPAGSAPRIETRLRLRADVELPLSAVFTELHRGAGVEVVAAGERLRRPIELAKSDPTAREVLDRLAEHLEGRWDRHGRLFVLGPPEGFEEIARTSPVQYPAYFSQQWSRLLRLMRSEDWKLLRERKPIELDGLREMLRPTVTEIARLTYWIHKDGPEGYRPTLQMVQKKQIALELANCLGHPGREILSVAVKDRVISQRVFRTFHHLNHSPWVMNSPEDPED